jgi:hypothetical protein
VAPFCSPQKADRKLPLGRSPGSEGANRVAIRGRFTFPGERAEWLIEATRLHSQWRDRAGFSPDFPVMPSWAPKANGILTQLPAGRASTSTCLFAAGADSDLKAEGPPSL